MTVISKSSTSENPCRDFQNLFCRGSTWDWSLTLSLVTSYSRNDQTRSKELMRNVKASILTILSPVLEKALQRLSEITDQLGIAILSLTHKMTVIPENPVFPNPVLHKNLCRDFRNLIWVGSAWGWSLTISLVTSYSHNDQTGEQPNSPEWVRIGVSKALFRLSRVQSWRKHYQWIQRLSLQPIFIWNWLNLFLNPSRILCYSTSKKPELHRLFGSNSRRLRLWPSQRSLYEKFTGNLAPGWH